MATMAVRCAAGVLGVADDARRDRFDVRPLLRKADGADMVDDAGVADVVSASWGL